MRIKIACDNHISKHNCEKLNNSGYDVVLRATDEPDWEWCTSAMLRGAEVFISCDWDIELYCKINRLKALQLPQGKGGKKQYDWVKSKLDALYGE